MKQTIGLVTALCRALCVACLAAQLATAAGAAASTRLMVWGIESGAETKDFDAEIGAFERRHPDIDVVTLSMGAGTMNPQKLMTAIVGGVPPDVVRQDRFTIGDWASRGAFRPLDDLVAVDSRSADPLAVHKADYVPATWAEAVYKGRVYAIPGGTDDRIFYYNRALFRQAGLDPDRPPRTWTELDRDARALTRRRPDGRYDVVGFLPAYGQGWLYLWAWQNGGDSLSADGRRCTLANPHTVAALDRIVRWYDDLGGYAALESYAGSFGSDEQDPFLTGQLAMKVDGDSFLQTIARYRPDLDFGCAPAPVPDDRYRHAGRFAGLATWVTWSGGSAWAIPRGARHVRAAWAFIKWMNSPAAARIGAAAQADYFRSKGCAYVPGISANRRATAAVLGRYDARLPGKFRAGHKVILGLLPVTRFRPVTVVGQRLWDEQARAVDRAVRHKASPEASLVQAQAIVQAELDQALQRERHPPLPERPVGFALALAALAAVLAVAAGVRRWMGRERPLGREQGRAGLAFATPWIVGTLLFTVGPIVASFILSFCDYDVLHPPRWAGLGNYRALLTLDRDYLGKAAANAAYLAVIGIPAGMATGLALALLLNTRLRGQRIYRTIFYLPSVVPVVATSVVWAWLLNPDPSRGLIDAVWQWALTPWSHVPPPGWLATPAWAKPGLILVGLWGAGGGMIIWLAGLQAIPASLYEAASLDGAGPLARFRHVTLPMLSPYIFFNLIIGTIGVLQSFETPYILGGTIGGSSTGPDDSLLVPSVYIFNNAFEYFKMGYASALAWLMFVVILALTLAQVKLAPRWVHTESGEP